MSTSMTICLVIFAQMIIGFIVGKTPMPLTALTAMLLLVVTGCLDSSAMLSCIGNTTVITITSMFVIAAGLNRTQMVKKVSGLVQKISGDSFSKGLLCYCIVTAMLAQVLPSAILVFSITYPLVSDFCKRMSVSTSKAIFSIGLVATSTVSIIPFGTGATFYINANTLMETYGITDYTVGMPKLVEATNGYSLVEAENDIWYDIVRGYGLRRSLFRRKGYFHGTKKKKTSTRRNG